MKRRDLVKKLEAAGYKINRDDGNHTIYEKDGSRPVQIPRHKEINENKVSVMAEYVYPAVFHPNEDGSYTIAYPDLPGCISEGKSLGSAMYMAQSALTQWIEYLTDTKQSVPMASDFRNMKIEQGDFINLIRADVKDNRTVKRTVSIPKWMDDKVIETGLSLSRVLQDALKEKLHVG